MSTSLSDLLDCLTHTNAKRHDEALAHLKALRQISRNTPGRYMTQRQPFRNAFRTAVCREGSAFHPVLRLPPKMLNPWVANRVDVPSRVSHITFLFSMRFRLLLGPLRFPTYVIHPMLSQRLLLTKQLRVRNT